MAHISQAVVVLVWIHVQVLQFGNVVLVWQFAAECCIISSVCRQYAVPDFSLRHSLARILLFTAFQGYLTPHISVCSNYARCDQLFCAVNAALGLCRCC